jgi:hypothetical protein
MRGVAVLDEQLSLPLSWLTESDFADALRQRGAGDVGKVRFKENRTRIVSVSADRSSVNVHTCFRAAPGDVLDAVATFVRAPQGSQAARRSVARMRSWWEGQMTGGDFETRGMSAPCCATAQQREFLRATYERLNALHFAGRLPPVPIRLSDRMSRRFGHVHYGRTRAGERVIEEIALSLDLMVKGNENHLVDTLLHEMAHVEAWIEHEHRDHGPPWRNVAVRVGCEPTACSAVRIRRRSRRLPLTRVPDLILPRLAHS